MTGHDDRYVTAAVTGHMRYWGTLGLRYLYSKALNC
jgi:hypothetical protein